MKKFVLDYLCKCEGWKTALQNIHWNADNMSQHKLCDDIAERLASFEDQVGEVEQSINGNLPFNKLKGTPYRIKNLKKYVEDVISDTDDFYKKVKKLGDKYVGMASDCESFMSDMQRNLYLVNFTMKEDFKRQYKAKINEGNKMIGNKVVRLSEKDFSKAINEAVKKVLEKYNINEAVVGKSNYSDKELGYTHFAVNKVTNLIVNGWDYSGYDSSELRQFKNDYFDVDLEDNGFNPKAYKILSYKACEKYGIDPNNQAKNWSNTGVFSLAKEIEMKKNGQDFWSIAYEEHPDWFVEN
jgi:archaellum component FlaC